MAQIEENRKQKLCGQDTSQSLQIIRVPIELLCDIWDSVNKLSKDFQNESNYSPSSYSQVVV